MNFSDGLATIAILVSIGSAIFSYKAHHQTLVLSKRNSNLEFRRELSEFLVRIEKSRKTFENSLESITNLLRNIENQAEEGTSSLSNEIAQLKNDCAYLQGCLRQAESLWHENYETSREGLAYHKPRHLRLLEDDEAFTKAAMDRAEKFAQSLELALAINKPLIG